MRVDVIGETGNNSAYLITNLVETSYEMISIGCGHHYPFHPHLAWLQVQSIAIDRESVDKTDIFGTQFRELRYEEIIDNKYCRVNRASTQFKTNKLRGSS